MSPKNDRRKRKNKNQRREQKNNNEPTVTMMSEIVSPQVNDETAQNSTPINTAQNPTGSKTILKEPNDDFAKIKSVAKNPTVTVNVTEKPNSSFEESKNTIQNSIVNGTGFQETIIYTNRLDIFKQISNLLTVDNKRFITILEILVGLHDDISAEKELRLHIVNLLLNYLETSDTKDLELLLKICQNSFSRQEFQKYIVDNKALDSEGILLGRGGFGTVNLGKLYKPDGSWTVVAVKQPVLVPGKTAYIEEAKVMTKFDHKNVVKILAFQKNPPKIAMGYLEWGNLNHALRDHHFSDKDILNALHDVSSGMEYISNMNYVHRDLACKNIFVNSKKQCKVGDFGFCKYLGDVNGLYKEEKYIIAMYNTAPESKLLQIFSIQSDVWAMGILMWEIYFLHQAADVPIFPLFEFSLILNTFQVTGSLPRPPRCPRDIYAYTIKRVLHRNPQQRPTFTEIKKLIARHLASFG